VRDTANDLDKFNIAVFMASVDDAETNKKFAESLGSKAPILSDPEKKVATAYGVLSPRGYAQRWTFLIDERGIVRAIDTHVNFETHGADLVKELQTLGVPKK
jgi:thioredoxin-dependent peroxiredoxin